VVRDRGDPLALAPKVLLHIILFRGDQGGLEGSGGIGGGCSQ